MLRPDDYVITTYRDHGQALARGITPRAVMAELFGRVDGCVHGKGGSMHMFDRHVNFLGGHGIVGGHIPIATGVGFAIKYRGGDQVCVCFLGEAAVNGGAFHESLNMAGLWKLPVVYVIENNRYGMGTAIERASSIKDLSKRGASYDIADDSVDGQDVLAVRETMAEARRARAHGDQTPRCIEVRTYRFVGHSMSDAASGTYRTKAELEEYEKRDPINLFRAVMQEDGDAHRRRLRSRWTTEIEGGGAGRLGLRRRQSRAAARGALRARAGRQHVRRHGGGLIRCPSSRIATP